MRPHLAMQGGCKTYSSNHYIHCRTPLLRGLITLLVFLPPFYKAMKKIRNLQSQKRTPQTMMQQ